MLNDMRIVEDLSDYICNDISDEDRGVVLACVEGLANLVAEYGDNAVTAIAYFSAKYNVQMNAATLEN